MRADEVKGKRIVKVLQTRFWNKRMADWAVACDGIELEDGSMLSFHVIELEDGYAIEVNRYTVTVDLGEAVDRKLRAFRRSTVASRRQR